MTGNPYLLGFYIRSGEFLVVKWGVILKNRGFQG
jgi:hypothetical protein